jgi:hypothetical protein
MHELQREKAQLDTLVHMLVLLTIVMRRVATALQQQLQGVQL